MTSRVDYYSNGIGIGGTLNTNSSSSSNNNSSSNKNTNNRRKNRMTKRKNKSKREKEEMTKLQPSSVQSNTGRLQPRIKSNPHSQSLQHHQQHHQQQPPPFELRRTQSSSSSILTKTQSSFKPISAHYNLNKRLYHAFFHIIQRRDDKYELALVIGLQFCRVSLFDIPTHGYYDSPKYYHMKLENAIDVMKVTNVLCDRVIPRLNLVYQQQEPYQYQNSDANNQKQQQQQSQKSPSKRAVDIQNKIDEAKLLKHVATGHLNDVQSKKSNTNRHDQSNNNHHHLYNNSNNTPYHAATTTTSEKSTKQQNIITSTASTVAKHPTHRTPETRKSLVQKEVVQVEDDDDLPRCLRMLDCGSMNSATSDFITSICSSYSSSASSTPTATSISSGGNTKYGKNNMTSLGTVNEMNVSTTGKIKSSHDRQQQQQQQQHQQSQQLQLNSSYHAMKAMSRPLDLSKTHSNVSAPAELGVGTPPTVQLPTATVATGIPANRNSKSNAVSTKRTTTSTTTTTTKPRDPKLPTSTTPTPTIATNTVTHPKSITARRTSMEDSKLQEDEYRNIRNDNNNNNYYYSRVTREQEQYEADLERALYLSGLEFQSQKAKSVDVPTTTTASSTSAGTSNHDQHNYQTRATIVKPPPPRSTTINDRGFTNEQQPHEDYNHQIITSTTAYNNRNLKRNERGHIDVQTISLIYKKDFLDMLQSKSIEVSYVNTYQGRIHGSCNGCTVIAPLLALHHLCNEKELSMRNDILMQGKYNSYNDYSSERTGNGSLAEEEKSVVTTATPSSSSISMEQVMIENQTIKAVIDIQAPIVLPKVRGGLGLHSDALIIPSDVHDFLMDCNMLKQNQFVDVCSGNILHDAHLAKFIETLGGFHAGDGGNSPLKDSEQAKTQEKSREKKLAATFFFHEHVISILMVTQEIYTSSMSLSSAASSSDKKKNKKKSMRKKILKRFGGGKNKKDQQKQRQQSGNSNATSTSDFDTTVKEESWFEIIDSLPGTAMLGLSPPYDNKRGRNIESSEDYGGAWIPRTARIRCYSMESLHAALRWYACSKFTPEDQKYINSYQWDHMNFEFDPRVFQAFIWSS